MAFIRACATPKSEQVNVGAEGFGGATQIMFYVDKYFVKVRLYSEATNGELLSFAKAVAERAAQ